MYCSTCGNSLSKGLAFCNKCGKRIKPDNDRDNNGGLSESSVNFLIAAMLGLPIAGLGILIGLMTVMKKELSFPDAMIFVVLIACLTLFLAVEAGFLWVLFTKLRRSKENPVSAQMQPMFEAANTRMLDEIRSTPVSTPGGSVTEHTTRNFTAIDRES